MSNTNCRAAADMTETMEQSFWHLQVKFQAISDQLRSKHVMGERVDELEKNVSDLMTQAGMEKDIPKSKELSETSPARVPLQ